MATLIDSSILIAAERSALDLEHRMRERPDETVAMASVTASELLHGVHRAANARQRNLREAFVERLLAEIPVLPFDLAAARVHAGLWAHLAAQGKPVGAHDLLIAATALAAGYDVATRDERGFRKIPGLRVHLW